jgi:hypothetical protein
MRGCGITPIEELLDQPNPGPIQIFEFYPNLQSIEPAGGYLWLEGVFRNSEQYRILRGNPGDLNGKFAAVGYAAIGDADRIPAQHFESPGKRPIPINVRKLIIASNDRLESRVWHQIRAMGQLRMLG